MLQRQREGIAKAKTEGRYRGRKPTARAKADDVRRLAAEGVSKVEIARRLGMHRASVYRALEAKLSGDPTRLQLDGVGRLGRRPVEPCRASTH